MSHFWTSIPLLRLVLPFVVGIIVCLYAPSDEEYFLYALLSCSLLLLAIAYWKKLQASYQHRWLFGVLLHLTLFVAGYYCVIQRTEKYHPQHFSHLITDSAYTVVAQIEEPLIEKKNSYKTVLAIKAIYQKDWEKTIGKAIAYLQKDSIAQQLQYGDVLLFASTFNNILPPQNPSEFNYKRYLSFHQIEQQVYLPTTQWHLLQQGQGNVVLQYAYVSQQRLLSILTDYGISGNEYAVASALILGNKNELDGTLRSAYSNAGAMHVLAVSGLHVGIVYVVLNFLLQFLLRIKHGAIIRALLLVIALWGYAILTGLSPSVMRAATMFSLLIVGEASIRNTNTYNTLMASAFALLVYNPYLIMEVGFQLSYLAVIGIVLIHPRIYHLWEAPNWLLNKAWVITTVSVAAQLATFPLALFYFHQFPNYFLFSNLVVIPAAAGIIYTGIVLFAVSSFPLIAAWIALALKYLLLFMNLIVQYIEQLPYSIVQGITITVGETWVIYLLIVCMLAYFTTIRIKYLYSVLVLFITLLGYQLYESYKQAHQKQWIVYNIPKTSVIDFIDGTHNFLLADSSLLHNDDRLLFHIKPNWWEMGIEENTFLPLQPFHDFKEKSLMRKENFIQFYDTRIAIVNQASLIDVSPKANIKVDYVVLTQNPKFSLKVISKHYHFNTLIIDASNSSWNTTKWMQEAKELDIKVYAVSQQGAFVVNV